MYKAVAIGLGVMGNIADGLGSRHQALFRPCSHADSYEKIGVFLKYGVMESRPALSAISMTA